jgi:hypothetical protein
LVPNTRISEIKSGFYEFQYTRELCEPTPTPGTRIVVADTNQRDECAHGTPKRQRTGRNELDVGSQSAPPKIASTADKNTCSTRQTVAAIYVATGKDTSKRKLFEIDMMDNTDKFATAGTSSSSLPQDKPAALDSLSDVHKSVIDALSPGQASSSVSVSPSFTQFLHTLVKSGSDKVFMIQIPERS